MKENKEKLKQSEELVKFFSGHCKKYNIDSSSAIGILEKLKWLLIHQQTFSLNQFIAIVKE